MKQVRLIAAIILLMLTGVMCKSTSEIPVLEANCSSYSFHLRGEITSIWKAQVQPDTQYEIVVRDGDSTPHGIHWIQIFVSDEKSNYFGPETTYTDTEAILSFVSPEETILIRVSSAIGEGSRDYGVFSIALCKGDS